MGLKVTFSSKYHIRIFLDISTLNRILKKEPVLVNNNNVDIRRMRIRKGVFDELDSHVYSWIVECRQKKMIVPGYMIIEKAKEIASALKINNFVGSQGWLKGFKIRNNLKSKRLHGESASVNTESVTQWLNNLPNIMKDYENKNIYNLDETALFYHLTQNQSVVLGSEKSFHGVKSSKTRVTLLVGCSMVGEKLPLTVIGKYKNPRCFKNVPTKPLNYYSQENSWMNSSIFYQILKDLNQKFKQQNRHVLIILDQCGAHPKVLENLEFIKLLFLPSNSTSSLQPLDLGIIHSLKSHYRNILCRHLLSLSECPHESKYTLLECMLSLKKAWEDVSSETIIKCWRKSGILSNHFYNVLDMVIMIFK